MSSQALEQVLEFVPTMRQESRAYQTIDVFTNGLSQMYTGKIQPIGGVFNPAPFFPTSTGFGVNVNNPYPVEFKDYHETFKVDRYDNLYNGHSTITPKEGEKFSIFHQPIDPLGGK